MKKNIITTGLLSLVLFAGIPCLTSCSGNKEEAQTKQHASAEGKEEVEVIRASYNVPDAFKNSFKKVTEHYLALKDALVASKPEEAQRHATALVSSLNEAEATALEGEAAQKWSTVEGKLKAGASQIAGTTDLAAQRGAFTELSNKMIEATEAFGAGTTVYKQHCPMANSNTGGSWLSSNKEVKNPYYGDAMLECGEVQAKIQDKE